MKFLRSFLFDEQRGKCHYCRVQMHMGTTGKYFCTVDHKTPKSKGGGNHINNLVGACFTCNNMRGNIPYQAFKRFIELYGNKSPIKQVMRNISRDEYLLHKPMWDAIHGITTIDIVQEQKPAWRRPYLYDVRGNLKPIVTAYNHEERSFVLYPQKLKEKYGGDQAITEGTADRTGGYGNPFFRLYAALGFDNP